MKINMGFSKAASKLRAIRKFKYRITRQKLNNNHMAVKKYENKLKRLERDG